MIRVLIGAEQAVIREGLKKIVAGDRDMVIAGEAGNGRELQKLIAGNPGDVVMLDIALPGITWLDTLKDIKNQKTSLAVMILSAHVNEDDAKRALRAGASGYLTTDCLPDELLSALKKVASGGKYVSVSLGEKLAFDLEKGLGKLPHESLSDREYQVMGLLASGKTVTEIADEMSLSVKTVSTYRSRIMEKLNLKNNVELARYHTSFIDTKTVNCRKCGQDNPQVAKFCSNCGSVLDAAAELPSTATVASTGSTGETGTARLQKRYQWVLASLAVVGVAGWVGWLLRPTPPTAVVPVPLVTGAEATVAQPINIQEELKANGSVTQPLDAIQAEPAGGGGPDTLAVPVVGELKDGIGAVSPVVPTPVELRYDDGADDAMLSSSGGGFLVNFSPPSVPFTIDKIRVFGMRHPSEKEQFEVQIWDNNRKIVYSAFYPVTAFYLMTESPHVWIDLDIPDIELKSDFFVHLYTGSYKQEGIAIGADNSRTSSRSELTDVTPQGAYVTRELWPFPEDNWWGNKDRITWMIRVVGQGK